MKARPIYLIDAPWRTAAAFVLAAAVCGADEYKRNATAASGHGGKEAHAAQSGQQAELRLASEQKDQLRAEAVAGRQVVGTSGQKLGTLKDVVVDQQNGRIASFVVSSGGVAGIGDTLRLVAYDAVQPSDEGAQLKVRLTDAQWQQLPAIEEGDLQAGRIDVAAQSPGSSSRSAQQQDDQFGQRLAAAAELRGKSVQAGDQTVGEIEDILLNLRDGTASALLDVENDFVASDRAFVVPLAQLEFAPDGDSVRTTLTRADFQRVAPSSDRGQATAAVSRSEARIDERTDERTGAQAGTDAARRDDQDITPTGRASEANAASVSPLLQSAARSVRQIWDAHPELRKMNLEVQAQNGRLVFRGSVPSAELWERAKDTAEGVVRDIEIENHIAIKEPGR